MTYGALSAKIRALYGKRLRADDFARLAGLKNEAELLEALRQHPGWSRALSLVPPGAWSYVGRVEMEGALRDELRGRGEVVCRGRTIPHRKVLSAMTLTLVVTLLFLTGSMILSLIDGLPFLPASFEIASALATVGLSMGVTPQLSWSSVLLVTGMMYLGRVGILSFSLAFLTRRERDSKLKYPTTEVMIG